MGNKPLITVQFYDPDVGYENLWASKLSDTSYRIENVPFFIYGISRHDVVAATPNEENRLQFVTVMERSGNRTLRARSEKFVRDKKFRERVVAALKKLGSNVEVLRSRLLAIDVPPGVDLEVVANYLTNDAKVSWEYGHPVSLHKS